MFSGIVINKVDAKGRVSVPAKFRQVLVEQGGESVVLIRSSNYPALEGLTPPMLAKLTARIDSLNPLSAEYDALARMIYAEQADCTWDGEGRIRLPDALRAYARLEDEIAFVGLGQKFQIWDPRVYEARHPADSELSRRNSALLGEPPPVSALGPAGGAA